MATEADSPEFIYATSKEGQDKELSSKPLNMGSNELPQEEMQKAEHRHNKPLEIFNSTGETENMQVATNINVDTANAVTQGDVGTVVGKVFFGVSPVPKVACQETSSGPNECETSEDEKNLVVTEEKSEEGQRETSYHDGEDEISCVSIISVVKEMDSEVTRPRKGEEEKNEREEFSTEKESPDNLNDEEVREKEEGAKDNLGEPFVVAIIEETSSKMAEQDDGGKLQDNSSIPFDESTKTTESSEKTDVTSTEVKKPSLVEKIEDISFQDDLENPTEILGEIVTTDTNVHTRGADEETSEPKVDASFTRQEESLQKESEVQVPIEVSTRENTAKKQFGAALPDEYSNTESAEHKEQFQQGLFTKIEPGEEKLERSSEVIPEEIKNKASSQQIETITAFAERGAIESFEEVLKDERNETTYHTDDIGKESSEEKNLSKDDVNEKIEREEAGKPKESASDSYFTHPLVNETVHAGDEKQDQVSSAELGEEACDGNRILKEEKELVNEAYETIRNPDSFRLEQSSIAGEVNMELISSTDNETVDVNKQVNEGPDVDEKDNDAESQILEEKHNVTGQSPDTTAEETFRCSQEEETKEEKPKPEKGDECQTTCANQCSRERVQEEENKIEDQALASIREGKTAETSEKDEEMEEVPKQEIPETTEEDKETIVPTNKVTGSDKESAESLEEETLRESSREVEMEENKSAQAKVETENQNIDEISNVHLPFSTATERNTEEHVNEKEMDVMASKQEVKNSDTTEHMEHIFDTTCPPEETKSKTLKGGEDNNTHCITGAAREIPSEETTENFAENSSAPYVYEKEMEEEILHKADTPVTWVTEETSLKEFNPEDKMQSESFDLFPDKHLATVEPLEIGSDDVNVIDKNAEATNLDEASEKVEASYVSTHSPLASETTEEKIQQIQDKFMDPEVHTCFISSDGEKDGANEEVHNEGGQQLYMTPALNTETPIIESEGVEFPESIKTSEVSDCSNIGELETSKDEKSQKTELDKDKLEDENPVNDTSIEERNTSTDTKEAIVRQEYSTRSFKSSSEEDVETEKAEVDAEAGGHTHKIEVCETSTNEMAEQVPATTIEGQDTITSVMEESDSDCKTQSIEQKTVQESSQEVQTSKENESAQANMDTENQTIEESSNANLPTSNAVEKTIEENYKEEESDASESKEEVKSSDTEHVEHNVDTTCPTEETQAETLNEGREYHTRCCTEALTNEDIGENSSAPPVLEKHTEEENLHAAEIKVTGESKGMQILTAPKHEIHPDEVRTEQESHGNNDILAKVNDEKKVSKGDKLLDYTTEENPMEPHILSSRELNLMTTETTDENPVEVEPSYVDTQSPLAADTTEEKQLQMEAESIDPEVRSYMASTDIEKDGENAEVHNEDQLLHMAPALKTETSITEPEDLELPKCIKTSEMVDLCNTGKVEISKDEKWLNNDLEKDKDEDKKPVNDGSSDTFNTSTEIEKAIQEEEHSARNTNSLKEEAKIQKEVGEVEAGDHIQEIEVPETESTSTPIEEVSETMKEGQDKVVPVIQQKDSGKGCNTECTEEKTVRDSFTEDEENKEKKRARANMETKDEKTREIADGNLLSSTIVGKSIQVTLKEDESDVMESKEEAKNSDIDPREQNFDMTCPSEEINAETLKDGAKPNHDCTDTSEVTPRKETDEDLVENTTVPPVSEKETEEGILHQAETTVTGVAEEAVLKELNEGGKIQSDSFGLASNKCLATVESFEKGSDGADIKHAEASDIHEHKNLEIVTPKIDDEREVSTGEMFQDYTSEHDLKESYAPSSSEHTLPTTEVSESTYETPEKVEPSYVSTHSPLASEMTEEKTLQIQDNSMNTEVHAYMASSDMEKDGAKEVHDEDQWPHMTPALNTEASIIEPGYVELLKSSKTSEVAESSNIGEGETSKDEKWLNAELEKDKHEDPATETSNEACNTSIETEKASVEQEHSAISVKSSLKADAEIKKKADAEIKKEAVELEAEGQVQEIEASKTNSTCTVTEENPESVYPQIQPRSDSESVTEDQSSKIVPTLDDVDVTAKLEDASKLAESKNMQIPRATKEDESGEKPDHELQNEMRDTSSKTEVEREVSPAETPIDYASEQNLEHSPMMSSGEHNHMTTESSETADEAPEKVEASYINAQTAEITEEKLLQKQVEPMDPRDEADLSLIDTEKSSANEEVHGEVQEIYEALAMNTEKIVTESQEVELRNTETSEVASCSDIDKLLQDQKSLNDELNKEKSDTETVIVEQASGEVEKADNTENVKEQIVEEGGCTTVLQMTSASNEIANKITDPDPLTIENLELTSFSEDKEKAKSQVAEDLSWESEASFITKAPEEDIKNAIEKPVNATNSLAEVLEEATEEQNNEEINSCNDMTNLAPVTLNLKSVEPIEGHRWSPKSEAESQSNKTCYEINTTKIEEDKQVQKTQDGVEAIKDVTLTEEVPRAVEETEEGDKTNRQIVKEESSRTELRTTLASCEIANKITSPDPVLIENLEVTDSSETPETLKLQDAKDLSWETEEDMKKGIEKPISITSSALELSAENIKQTDSCNDKTDIAPITLNCELVELEPQEKIRCETEIEAEDQSNKTIHETKFEEDSSSVADTTLLSIREKVIGQDIQGGMQMTGEVQPTLETKNQIEQRQTTTERIKDASLIEEVSQDITLTVTYCYSCYQSGKFQFMIFSPVDQVSGATEKTNESENIKEKIIKEESRTLEIQVKSTSNEMETEPAPMPTENLEATSSCENTETVKTLAAEDLDWESEASSITKAPEEDTKKAVEESINITSPVVTISEETFEEKNTDKADSCDHKTHIAPVTLVTEETTTEEVQLMEKSIRDVDTISDDKILVVKTTSTGLQGEFDSAKLEDNSSMLSPLSTEGANVKNESENLESAYGVEFEEGVTSDAVSKSKEKDVEDIHGIQESPTVDRTDADKVEEEINGVLQTISEPDHQGVDSVIAGEVLLHQTLPSGNLTEQVQKISSAMPSQEENIETTSKTEKIEEDNTKKDENLVNEILESSFATSTEEDKCLQNDDPGELEVSNLELELIEDPKNDSPDEAPKEESTSLEESTSVEPQENVSKISFVDSPSESQESLGVGKTIQYSSKETSEEDSLDSWNSNNKAVDLPSHCSTVKEILTLEVDEKCEEPSTLDFQKTEKALESMTEEEPAKSEETEIKDEQMTTATTEPKVEGNQIGITTEASKTIRNEIKFARATEKEFAKDSQVGSPNEKAVKHNYKEDVQVAPGEKIQELDTTKNVIQNEELSKEHKSASLGKDNEKRVKGKDGAVEEPYQDSVGDGIVNEILQEEAEGKKVAEAPTKLDLQKMSDDTNCRDTNTATMALSQEVR
ncbi:hypothetical protein LguiA_017042 [Lonicera macranthoides]